ncbi:MAG: hypothetical protein K6L75_01270 [Cellvibrionaceae bacterium]
MTISKIIFSLLFILIAASMFFYSVKGKGMSLFGKGEKVCIFSGFDGKITLNGEPASGAKIIRKAQWMDDVEPKSKEYFAGKNGEFSFESWWALDQRKFVPQFASSQQISVIYKDETYEIWGAGKLDTKENEEFSYKYPKKLSCELTDDSIFIQLDGGSFISTSCQWTIGD